jgi:hypothetical protein
LFSYFDACLGEKGENFSFFHQLITKLKARRDVLQMDTERVQMLCDLASAVLNAKSSEGKYIISIYPGKIFIPSYFKEGEPVLLSKSFLGANFKLNEMKKKSPKKKKEETTPSKRKRGGDDKKKKKKKVENSETEEDYVTSDEEVVVVTPSKRIPRQTPSKKTPIKDTPVKELEPIEQEPEEPKETFGRRMRL